MSTPPAPSLSEAAPVAVTRRARNVRILDAPDSTREPGAAQSPGQGAAPALGLQPAAAAADGSSLSTSSGGFGGGGGLLLSPSAAGVGEGPQKIPKPPRDGAPSRERANTVVPKAPVTSGGTSSGASSSSGERPGASSATTGTTKRRESHRSSIRQLSASTATEDRSLLDQRLFYAKSRESGRRHFAPFGSVGDVAFYATKEFGSGAGGMSTSVDSAALSVSGRPSDVEVAAPVDLTMPWASFLSLRFVTVHTPFSDVAVLDGCVDPSQLQAELVPSLVSISDRVSVQFVTSLKDFYRTGARFSKRRSCATTLPPAPAALMARSVNASLSSSVLGASAAGRPSPPQALATRPASASYDGASELRTKVAAIEQQIAEMRSVSSDGRSSAMTAASNSGMGDYLDDFVGANSVSFRFMDGLSGKANSAECKEHPPMGSSLSFRSLDMSFQATDAKPHLKRIVESRKSRGAHLDDPRQYDSNPDSLPESHLVDRFTPPSLEALAAVAIRLGSTLHAKLRHVQLLNLSGCGIGDDGLFVVLQAIRFGPLHRVQCLDLMYNQLTSVAAFYMGIFLLLRPPAEFVNPVVNDALRASYSEARVPVDATQKALEVIAAQRAQAKAGGSSSANKQSPPFFFPHSASSKTLLDFFFGGRSGGKMSGRAGGGGGGSFFTEAPQSHQSGLTQHHLQHRNSQYPQPTSQRQWSFGGRGSSGARSLKSAASAVMTVGVLRKRISQRSTTSSQLRGGSASAPTRVPFLADPSIVNISESGFGPGNDDDGFLDDEYDDDDLHSGDSDEESSSSSDGSEADDEAVGMGITEHFRELEMILTPTHQQQTQQRAAVPQGRSGAAASGAESPVPPLTSPRAAAADRRRSLMTTMAPAVAAKIRRLQEKDQLNAATDLVSLRIGWNDLQDVGIATLAEWIGCQTFLLELDVSYNDAQEDGFAFLRESLRSNTSLVSLNTEGNTMDDATAEALRGTLLYNRRLLKKVQHAAAAGGGQTSGAMDSSTTALNSSLLR